MRKIFVAEYMTLDGVVEAPGPAESFEYRDWTGPYFSQEIMQIVGGSFATSDAMLLGRKTYQGFEAAFASQSGGMADVMNNQPKYVVSTTLKSADWNNSTLINENIFEEIAKLKQQPGKDIAVSGSITLAQSLLAHGLVDELSLLVYPLVLGKGMRLFTEGLPKTAFKLVEATPTPPGVVHLVYQPE